MRLRCDSVPNRGESDAPTPCGRSRNRSFQTGRPFICKRLPAGPEESQAFSGPAGFLFTGAPHRTFVPLPVSTAATRETIDVRFRWTVAVFGPANAVEAPRFTARLTRPTD